MHIHAVSILWEVDGIHKINMRNLGMCKPPPVLQRGIAGIAEKLIEDKGGEWVQVDSSKLVYKS
jgi:hypothetical protein